MGFYAVHFAQPLPVYCRLCFRWHQLLRFSNERCQQLPPASGIVILVLLIIRLWQIAVGTDAALPFTDSSDNFVYPGRVFFHTRCRPDEILQIIPIRKRPGHDGRRFLVSSTVESHGRPVGTAGHMFNKPAAGDDPLPYRPDCPD